ncbi:hypothetical protein JR316_0010103 [Psilocybe cubensis]|uniref:Uncharacterized protein n=2 Tax=Psilocybe cubensis TaxID=181762 RepID=A0ACB8GQM7_PSICU|nr:hypothetical protein JR316_0010103 [Psilocybe cubensis]KAH9477871.1 hypothetical protein JR316_0010103 [Psilocybe cubensis]
MVLFMFLGKSPEITVHLEKQTQPKQHAMTKPVDFIDKFQIYVVSLPGRGARKADMERLRGALGLQWKYYDATYSNSALIGKILHWVENVRAKLLSAIPSTDSDVSGSLGNDDSYSDGDIHAEDVLFWPEYLEDIAQSNLEIPLLDPLIWAQPVRRPPYEPLTCSEQDFYLLDKAPDEVPEYKRLTSGRVACWHSHLSVLHLHANSLPTASGKGSIALILEDDVDMERDIMQQMEFLWKDLPEDWDMVFLGHCWSDETRGSLITKESPTNGSLPTWSKMYTSTDPKCTHAYAVSRAGARRLLLHLTHPPFAYSRAIDQAYAWLIESKRIQSFSVVPNLAMQRKVTVSDVMEGGTVNNLWIDSLFNSVLDSLQED